MLASEANAALIGKPPTNLGLVGYWSMNEGTGTIAGDSSGNNNRGILTNGPTWVDGKRGKALNFDGSNDYVNAGSDSSLDKLGPMTVSAWIYPRTLGFSNAGIIINKENNTSAGWLFRLNNVIANSFFFRDFGNTANVQVTTSANTVSLNKWQQVVFTWDGSQTAANVHIYKDGVELTYASQSNGAGGVADDSALNSIIGCSQTCSYGVFQGLIDDVRVYNRALSAAEIQALYKSGASRQTQGPSNLGLVGYWSFNDATSTNTTFPTRAGDFSGNGNNGILTNGPTWVDGKRGKALNFDANDDLVSVGTSASLNITGAFTISGWIYPRTFGSSGSSFRGRIVDKENDFLSGYSLSLYDPGTAGVPNDTFALFINASGGNLNCFANDNSIVLKRWQHVAVTLDSSKNCIPYVNGAKATTTGGFIMGSFPGSGSNIFTIGNNSGNTREFDGSLDDVRVYNRALSASEVQALYQADYAKVNAPQNNQITNGLVGMWSFNGPDMSGTTAYDRSGQGNNGTLTNGPTPAIGKIGQALNFDGVDDYVSVPDNARLDLTTSISVSAWVKLNSYNNSSPFLSGILSKAGTGADMTGYDIRLGDGTSGNKDKLHFTFGTSVSWAESSGNVSIPLNMWTHVAVTYNQQQVILYVNGVRDTATTQLSAIAANNLILSIGDGYQWTDNRFMTGLIDDVRVYNRALSAAEIYRLYNMGR